MTSRGVRIVWLVVVVGVVLYLGIFGPPLRPTFWTVTAVIAGIWVASFLWHLFLPDWMPPEVTAEASVGWYWIVDHLKRKGDRYGTDQAGHEAGDA